MRRPGFTLMELTVVTALMAVTLAAALPFLHSFRQTETLRTTSQDVYQTLTRARHRAQTTERGSAWGVRILSGSYVLYAGNAYAERVATYDESHAVSALIRFSGLSEVTFRKQSGAPLAQGTLTLSDTDGDFVSIAVNAAGRIAFD